MYNGQGNGGYTYVKETIDRFCVWATPGHRNDVRRGGGPGRTARGDCRNAPGTPRSKPCLDCRLPELEWQRLCLGTRTLGSSTPATRPVGSPSLGSPPRRLGYDRRTLALSRFSCWNCSVRFPLANRFAKSAVYREVHRPREVALQKDCQLSRPRKNKAPLATVDGSNDLPGSLIRAELEPFLGGPPQRRLVIDLCIHKPGHNVCHTDSVGG